MLEEAGLAIIDYQSGDQRWNQTLRRHQIE